VPFGIGREGHEVEEVDGEPLGDQRERGERRGHQTFFDATEVALGPEAGFVGELFLRQTLKLSELMNALADFGGEGIRVAPPRHAA
jgi:hypothetical protein